MNAKNGDVAAWEGSLDDLVAIKNLAAELGIGAPRLHKYAKDLGIETDSH